MAAVEVLVGVYLAAARFNLPCFQKEGAAYRLNIPLNFRARERLRDCASDRLQKNLAVMSTFIFPDHGVSGEKRPKLAWNQDGELSKVFFEENDRMLATLKSDRTLAALTGQGYTGARCLSAPEGLATFQLLATYLNFSSDKFG